MSQETEYVGTKINNKRDLTKEEIELQEKWILKNGKPIRKELIPELEILFKKDNVKCMITEN